MNFLFFHFSLIYNSFLITYQKKKKKKNFSSHFSPKHSLFFSHIYSISVLSFFCLFFPLTWSCPQFLFLFFIFIYKKKKERLGHACSYVQRVSCVSAVSDTGTAAQLLCPCFPEFLSCSLEYIIGDYNASQDILCNYLGFKNGSCCKYQHCVLSS